MLGPLSLSVSGARPHVCTREGRRGKRSSFFERIASVCQWGYRRFSFRCLKLVLVLRVRRPSGLCPGFRCPACPDQRTEAAETGRPSSGFLLTGLPPPPGPVLLVFSPASSSNSFWLACESLVSLQQRQFPFSILNVSAQFAFIHFVGGRLRSICIRKSVHSLKDVPP